MLDRWGNFWTHPESEVAATFVRRFPDLLRRGGYSSLHVFTVRRTLEEALASAVDDKKSRIHVVYTIWPDRVFVELDHRGIKVTK